MSPAVGVDAVGETNTRRQGTGLLESHVALIPFLAVLLEGE